MIFFVFFGGAALMGMATFIITPLSFIIGIIVKIVLYLEDNS